MTFNREIVRILQRKCLQCHAPGGVAMSLATYREARPWARAIREELVEQRMPPWGPAPGYAPIAPDAGLTAREMAMLLTWVDGGVPRGAERDLPPDVLPRTARAAATDQVVDLPAQTIPALEEHVVRRVTVTPGGPARQLARVEVRPGNRRVLRTAFVRVITPGARHWIGAWTPWQPSVTAPEGVAFTLPAGAQLEVELHYRGDDTAAEDRTAVALFDAPATTPAGTSLGLTPRVPLRLREPARVWAIVPETPHRTASAAAGGSLEVTARRPDGSVEVLLWIPQYRHDWPTPYVLKTPIALPANTVVTAIATGASVSRVILAASATPPTQ